MMVLFCCFKLAAGILLFLVGGFWAWAWAWACAWAVGHLCVLFCCLLVGGVSGG